MSETLPILAVITSAREEVGGGGAPIFYCQTDAELQKVAFTLEKCLDATVHEITPSTYIIVKH